MGVIISSLTKPLRSFNIENRAQKILNRQKPVPSPPYPSTVDQLRVSEEANPNFMKDHYKKDEKLHDRLKHVFVSSRVQQVGSINEIPEKPLPHCRTGEEDFDYGFWEPSDVPTGRCYLRTTLQFMTDHLTAPEKHSVESIASQYELESRDVGNILEYYRVYQVMENDATNTVPVSKDYVEGKIADK